MILSLLLVAQATNRVSAVNPTTGPVTGPVTGPLTGPASLFSISGNVKYHFLGMLARGAARFMPAAGVNVMATDLFSTHSVSTTTDANGNYTLNTGKTGFYKVQVVGGQTSFYAPPVRLENENKPRVKTNADFQGLIFKL